MDIQIPAVMLSVFAMLSTICGGLAQSVEKPPSFASGDEPGCSLVLRSLICCPESIEAAQSRGWSVRAMLLVLVIGFLGFYVAERVLVLDSVPEGDCVNEAHRRVSR